MPLSGVFIKLFNEFVALQLFKLYLFFQIHKWSKTEPQEYISILVVRGSRVAVVFLD